MNNDTYSYVALGSFDGLHKGHLSLIKKTVELAKKINGISVVYTFRNHPRKFIQSIDNPKLLLDNKSKKEILKKENIDLVYFEEFNKEFMKFSPEQFIKYLCEKFNVKGIVVGFNYRFGYKNSGDVNLLKELAKTYNYELYVMEPCVYNEEAISSTKIRQALIRGALNEANEMLTRPFFIRGEVVHGKQLGRTIGFPTANLNFSKDIILPKIGVYYTNVLWNNKIYKGITSIGNNPTVNGEKITLETFILDFDKDIYDEEIYVYFIKFLREEKKFASIENLKNQLKLDAQIASKENIWAIE